MFDQSRLIQSFGRRQGIGCFPRLMRGNDLENIREFYEKHKNSLFLYAISLVQDRQLAEDIISDIFMRLLALDELPRKIRPYMFSCVRNAVTDEHRKGIVKLDAMFEIQDQRRDASGNHGDAVFLRRLQLQEALGRLNSNERETIILKIFAGLTFREISAIHDVPRDTVASWYRRGLEKLAKLVGGVAS